MSVREHISGTARPIFTIFVQIRCGCGSVLLGWRYDTLCTYGCMDDVTFGRSGPDGDTCRLHVAATTMNDVVIPGRSLMSMNALCLNLR